MKLPTFLAALLVLAVSAFAEDAKHETLSLGASAPDFKLPGVDGRDWSLSDFAAAKALVVVFTCNHCPTAQAYEERLKKIVDDYKAAASPSWPSRRTTPARCGSTNSATPISATRSRR